MNRLTLGSGKARRPGWLTLDSNSGYNPDFIATIPPLPADVKLQLWDEIEWIHGIGSLYPWQAVELLPELHAALAPDGILSLEQPDARMAAKQMLAAEGYEWWMFGRSDERNPLNMNHWAYTPESLTRALCSAGFTRVDVLPARHHSVVRDFRIEARP